MKWSASATSHLHRPSSRSRSVLDHAEVTPAWGRKGDGTIPSRPTSRNLSRRQIPFIWGPPAPRGGPKGFLKVLDEKTLAFADFGGNRQYISVGNLSENDKAFIFLMCYFTRRRVKIWGRAEVVERRSGAAGETGGPEIQGAAGTAFVFHVEAWDVNCQQHITPRFTEEEIKPELQKLQARIEELEAEVKELRS